MTLTDFIIYLFTLFVLYFLTRKSRKGDLEWAHQEAKRAVQTPTPRRLIEEKLGYPLEKHVYTTKDGYINTVYRIPGPKVAGKKPVIIYQHGLIDCSNSIICAEEDSLGLRLVNAGYDLWMNNSRGNRYSKEHMHIDVEYATKEQRDKYFEFSFQELAEFDQPALWEYVMNVTGAEKITYVGHS